jgi:hypothetical protein
MLRVSVELSKFGLCKYAILIAPANGGTLHAGVLWASERVD